MTAWRTDRDRAALLAGVIRRAAACFPERQIYIRSAGRVRFYTVGRAMQAAAAGLLAVFLAWVAFSTVVVVFKDRILAAEDHRFQAMQAAFESRFAALQMSYDDLVAKAANAQAYADRRVAALGQREQALTRTSGVVHGADLEPAPAADAAKTMPERPGFLSGAWRWLGLTRARPHPQRHHPSLDRLAADTALLAQLSRDSTGLMAAMERGTLQQVTGEKALIATAGIDADQFLRKLEGGVGGPEIPLDAVQLDGVADHAFSQAYLRAEANLAELAQLRRAVQRLPTAMPLGAAVERTSGFGPRLDPFSGQYAFHPGIDFAGPTGAAVLATAGGLVTFAGRDGGYGNMVEIDHGYGLKTRYAHLLSVAVTKGQTVAKGAVVGRLGSTGRSTGPHVHYEVWYDDKVRNPDGFLRVGVVVLQHCRGESSGKACGIKPIGPDSP